MGAALQIKSRAYFHKKSWRAIYLQNYVFKLGKFMENKICMLLLQMDIGTNSCLKKSLRCTQGSRKDIGKKL